MTDILDFDFTNPDAVLPDDLYVPEGRGADYITFLDGELARAQATGDEQAADHYSNRIAVAEAGLTLEEAATLEVE